MNERACDSMVKCVARKVINSSRLSGVSCRVVVPASPSGQFMRSVYDDGSIVLRPLTLKDAGVSTDILLSHTVETLADIDTLPDSIGDSK